MRLEPGCDSNHHARQDLHTVAPGSDTRRRDVSKIVVYTVGFGMYFPRFSETKDLACRPRHPSVLVTLPLSGN